MYIYIYTLVRYLETTSSSQVHRSLPDIFFTLCRRPALFVWKGCLCCTQSRWVHGYLCRLGRLSGRSLGLRILVRFFSAYLALCGSCQKMCLGQDSCPKHLTMVLNPSRYARVEKDGSGWKRYEQVANVSTCFNQLSQHFPTCSLKSKRLHSFRFLLLCDCPEVPLTKNRQSLRTDQSRSEHCKHLQAHHAIHQYLRGAKNTRKCPPGRPSLSRIDPQLCEDGRDRKGLIECGEQVAVAPHHSTSIHTILSKSMQQSDLTVRSLMIFDGLAVFGCLMDVLRPLHRLRYNDWVSLVAQRPFLSSCCLSPSHPQRCVHDLPSNRLEDAAVWSMPVG